MESFGIAPRGGSEVDKTKMTYFKDDDVFHLVIFVEILSHDT